MTELGEPVCISKRVFVGAVPVKMEEGTLRSAATLKDYFAQFGPVAHFRLGRNQKTQEPLGFAFVEFADESVAKKVLGLKHFVHGREVREAEQVDVKQFAVDEQVAAQQQDSLKRKVYVKGLPPNCDKTKLHEVFSRFGQVDKAFILYNHKNGSTRGFGFVEFLAQQAAADAVGKVVEICGKEIQISMAIQRHKGVPPTHPEKKPPRCTNPPRARDQ